MFATPQSPALAMKRDKSELESYIDDILMRSKLAADELDRLIASIPVNKAPVTTQFDKSKGLLSHPETPRLLIASPRNELSIDYFDRDESSIHLSPASSRYPESMISIPPRPSSTCERRPSNLRAHRMLAPQPTYAVDADDEEGGDTNENSTIIPTPSRITRHNRPFVDLTNGSIDNLPNFEYLAHKPEEISFSRSEVNEDKVTAEIGLAWKREKLFLEIMRNYGEEFS
jgi:hypothetical protein